MSKLLNCPRWIRFLLVAAQWTPWSICQIRVTELCKKRSDVLLHCLETAQTCKWIYKLIEMSGFRRFLESKQWLRLYRQMETKKVNDQWALFGLWEVEWHVACANEVVYSALGALLPINIIKVLFPWNPTSSLYLGFGIMLIFRNSDFHGWQLKFYNNSTKLQ